MANRRTTTLLMMAYLASQLAAVPHAHGGGGQPSDHNARSHVHVSWFAWLSHFPDRDTHHEECDACHSLPISSDLTGEHDGHDSDAVYLANETGTASLVGKSVISLDSLQFVSMLAIAAAPMTSAICDCWAEASFPDKCSSGTPLYLTLRALRI